MSKPRKEKPVLGAQLQNFAQQQLTAAIQYLTAPQPKPDTAIHETRRCLKRLRALLHLLKSQLPPEVFADENACWRDAARQLSHLRDGAARRETFAQLQQEFAASLPALAWQATKKALVTKVTRHSKRAAMQQVAQSLQASANNFPAHYGQVDKAEVLRNALGKSFKQGKRKMNQALLVTSAEHYHEWRKKVNHLRHQLRLLQELKFPINKDIADDIKMLAQTLGSHHDLTLLGQYLAALDLRLTDEERAILQNLIQQRCTQCEKEANKIGARIYQIKPKKFLAQLWNE